MQRKPAKKSNLEQPTMVGLGVCSAPILRFLPRWYRGSSKMCGLVELPDDCALQVQCVVRRPGYKEERDRVTVDEGDGEVSHGEVGLTWNALPRFSMTHAASRFPRKTCVTRCASSGHCHCCPESAVNNREAPEKIDRCRQSRALLSLFRQSAVCQSMTDCVTRSMRLFPKNTFSTENTRINEAAQKLCDQSVLGGEASTSERVLSSRTELLRCQVRCRLWCYFSRASLHLR